MRSELRLRMKKQSRLVRGLLNILRDDVEIIRMDIEEYNLLSLEESIKETKDTIQRMTDYIVALEYELYLANRQDSRDKEIL